MEVSDKYIARAMGYAVLLIGKISINESHGGSCRSPIRDRMFRVLSRSFAHPFAIDLPSLLHRFLSVLCLSCRYAAGWSNPMRMIGQVECKWGGSQCDYPSRCRDRTCTWVARRADQYNPGSVFFARCWTMHTAYRSVPQGCGKPHPEYKQTWQ